MKNDDLKEFLSPILKITGAHEVNKFGANTKTCAQAVDIEIGTTDRKALKTQKDKEISKKKNEIERMKMNEMDDTVKRMKQQIEDLNEVIVELVSGEHSHDASQQGFILK